MMKRRTYTYEITYTWDTLEVAQIVTAGSVVEARIKAKIPKRATNVKVSRA
jgi:hypothetical protein